VEKMFKCPCLVWGSERSLVASGSYGGTRCSIV
jgi:hypothetical protein